MRYVLGQGVDQNYETALKWYKLAAEQGLEIAQYALGLMYMRGQGTSIDRTLAYMWLDITAAHGNEAARRDRNDVTGGMLRSQIETAERLSSEWMGKHQK